jgi:ribosomal protein S18 acetylase RimI-like enzyme
MHPSRHTFSTVHCNLFFNGPSKRSRRGAWKVPEIALLQLGEAPVSFPHRIDLEYKGSNASGEKSKHIKIRNLELADLRTVVPMCVREFGTGDSITSLDDIPWEELMNNPSSLHDLSDRLFFGPLVRWALEMKIQRQRSGVGSRRNVKPDDNVLCLESDGRVVAIVELSMQPPDAQRNPPPVPLPMIFKELLSSIHGLPPPDGWVTNLLVDDAYRGLGYSKVLMKAVEGLAKSWDCSAIYLHVDADTESGKVAQDLYRGLGYKPVMDQRSTKKYDWMGPELMSLGLYVVDDVPLLFLRKNLTKT